MTILTNPPQHGNGHAATRWHKTDHQNETAGHTDAWEPETFGEQQARLERSDARIPDDADAARLRPRDDTVFLCWRDEAR